MSHASDIATYFGACPVCGQGGIVRSIGRDHWFCCEEHKVKWWGGSNLIRHEPMTAAEVVTTARYLKDFIEVAPYHPKANRR
jgi:hypothetical protein